MDKFSAKMNDGPNRLEIDEDIYHDTQEKPFTWGDILRGLVEKKLTLQQEDILRVEYVEAYFSENNSWDAHWVCTVTRSRPESDEEFKERQESNTKYREELKERRYQTYLKLKKEFEP